MTDINVLVIGAGPNGLSVAAHLAAHGVEHRVLGQTMGAWRTNMPKGMYLKSEPYASDLSAPGTSYLLGDYCAAHGEAYRARVEPVAVDRFISYGTWFADQLVPVIEDVVVTSVARTGEGFAVRTYRGDQLTAARVVVSTGVIPFAHMPAELASLPTELASHTASHTDLSAFRGREVLVIGAGQSALESAALLHEGGAAVSLVVRPGRGLSWLDPNPSAPTRLDRLRRPVVRLCEGWFCWRYDRLQDLFRLLPDEVRIEKAATVLGPSGAWWLRDRVEGRLPVLADHAIVEARARGDRVALRLNGPEGTVSREADHVVAGTGFRLDINRLRFLAPDIRAALRLVGGAPVLDHGFESSVPGLFFTGAVAAPTFGPAMRFVAGTHFTAPRLARRLRSLDRRRAWAGPTSMGSPLRVGSSV